MVPSARLSYAVAADAAGARACACREKLLTCVCACGMCACAACACAAEPPHPSLRWPARCRCLIEIYTALTRGKPVVTIKIDGLAAGAYDFEASAAYLSDLGTKLDEIDPGATRLLKEHGVDPPFAGRAILSYLHDTISLPYHVNWPSSLTNAAINDIVQAVQDARPPETVVKRMQAMRVISRWASSSRWSKGPAASPRAGSSAWANAVARVRAAASQDAARTAAATDAARAAAASRQMSPAQAAARVIAPLAVSVPPL
jgi:hypothetical protein